jgi:membrane associated rhomboid family serine protease
VVAPAAPHRYQGFMPNWEQPDPVMALPKPGPALRGILIGLLGVWLMFAVALNWGGADRGLFEFFVGNTEAIASGQIWRLFTAPLIHMPNDPWHVVGVLLGLFFLGPSLEARWGGRRFAFFLYVSAVLAYACQFLAEASFSGAAGKLSSGIWFGGVPAIEALSVAWALTFRGQTIRLLFVLPVTATGLLWFVIGFSVLRLIAVQQTAEGLISPFGGLAAGWLLGAGTPSPLRRLYLKFRYNQLDREAKREGKKRGRRVEHSRFSVIEGGRRDDDDGPGGKYLN